MIRGIVLEGISCSGKTSVLKALKKAQAFTPDGERSIIALGEHYSQVLQSVGGKPIRHSESEHRIILDERVKLLESLHGYATSLGAASRRARGLLFIFERFHLNHRLAFSEGDLGHIQGIESRLLAVNAICVLLSVSDARIEERLAHRGAAAWERKSDDEKSVAVTESRTYQERLHEASKKSSLTTLIVNTDELDWDGYATKILNEINKNQPSISLNSSGLRPLS